MQQSTNRLTMTVKEMSEALGINLTAAYALAGQAGFPAIKIGKRILIPREGLRRWIDTQSGAPMDRAEQLLPSGW